MSPPSPVVPQPMPTAITVRGNECPDVSGYEHAEAGRLSVGGFTAEDIGPQPQGQDGHKVCIAFQHKGHDDAILRVAPPRRPGSPGEAKVRCVAGGRCRAVLSRNTFGNEERC
jgi:hypothetical protein